MTSKDRCEEKHVISENLKTDNFKLKTDNFVTGQSGFALVMVMVSVLILEIVCFFLAQSRGIQTMTVFNRTKKLKALYLAEAGLAHGLWRLQKDPSWRTQMTGLSLGDGSYTVSFTEDTPHRLISVNSQSVAQGTKSSAKRTVCWVTIQPKGSDFFKGEDAYISEKDPDNRYGYTDPNRLMLDSETNKKYRTLVRFNLGKYPIPPDAAVISSRFSLYLVKGPDDNPSKWPLAVSYRIHRITRPPDNVQWVDLETTWKNRTSSLTWTNAGGDFDSGGYEDSRTFTALGWQTWRATVMTRLWMQNPSQNNYGLILETDPISGNYEFKFHSSAHTALGPELTVYYLDSRRP